MKVSNSFLNISGKRIKLFAEVINTLRPGLQIDVVEWKKMLPEVRRRKIATFFAMHGFTENELRQIKRTVFRVKIPFKLILTCLMVFVIAFMSFKAYQFFELPRIYAIGNNVAITTAMDSSGRVVKQLDLSGESNVGKSTGNSMLLISDTGAYYVVQNDDFIDWFLGKAQSYYVGKINCVTKKAEYDEYSRIFGKARGMADLDQLTAVDRIAIKTCIDNTPDLFKSVLEVKKASAGGYKPFIAVDGTGDQRYIFLCFKKQNNKLYNLQVICQQGIFHSQKEVASHLGKTFNEPLQWKLEGTSEFPIVYFSNHSTTETYQSLFPPYANFLRP